MLQQEFDVIIIGGGITGIGTARDCAMRGLKTILVERGDIADGASGRNHGLLHSGARYAMEDTALARECHIENQILRKIASNCIETTGGIFVTLPEDEDSGFGLDWQGRFITACAAAGIKAVATDPARARIMEPSINPSLIGAVTVPDCSIDPFRLCCANMLDAQMHGAKILRNTEFIDFIRQGDRILGIRILDRTNGVTRELRGHITVNAAGAWGYQVARKAGAELNMYPAKGSLLVFGHRLNRMVINRCRKSGDGDILAPGGSVSILGTTSSKVPFAECDRIQVTRGEVELLLREGSALCPSLASSRILRAYAGIRPLIDTGRHSSGRNISRGTVCIDHGKTDGIEGFVTISGGKLTTYRLMAETVTDLVCDKLGIKRKCRTAVTPLMSSEGYEPGEDLSRKFWHNPKIGQKAAAVRHGILSRKIRFNSSEELECLCKCEHVTLGEIRYAVRELGVRSLADLRHRTRIGMGTCQGTCCTRRIAAALAKELGVPEKADSFLEEYLDERWKGMRAVGWGDTLREMELMQKVYKEGIEL